MALTFDDLTAGLAGHLQTVLNPPRAATPIVGVAIDSRQIGPGELFVALKGERADGHAYVADAAAHGAAAILVERLPERIDELPAAILLVDNCLAGVQALAAFHRRRHPVRVVGITGSVGKTTTKELVAAVLGRHFDTLWSRASYNNELGLPLTLLQLRPEHERVVLELGTYGPGEIRQLCGIARPQIGVVTNVGPVHLERMGTIERIVEAKRELVEELPADGLAVLNVDDPRVRSMADRCPGDVVFYGFDPAARITADEIEGRGLAGVRFVLRADGERCPVALPVPGRHNVANALAAAAVGLAEGVRLEAIATALREIPGRSRLLVRPGVNDTTILDDCYNASPAAVLAALEVLDDQSGRKLGVLGDMRELGSFAEEGHRQVGRRAAEILDHLIVVGELGAIIGEGARKSGLSVFVAASNDAAAEHLRTLLRPGDTVLVKGSRAMHMETIVEQVIRED